MAPNNLKKSANKTKKVCKCRECQEKVITDDEDSIQCDKCEHWIHYQCSGLNKKQLSKVVDHDDTEYICHLCNPRSSNITDIGKTMKTLITKVDDLTSTVKFLGDKYDDFYKQFQQQNKRIKTLEKENKSLKASLNQVLYDQQTLFSEVNRNKIILKGIKTTPTDETAVKNLVIDMAIKGGSSVIIDDIMEVSTMSNRNRAGSSGQAQSAIVTFKSFSKKLAFVTKRKAIKSVEEFKNISITDLLPKSSQKLYTHALALRNVGFVAVYHQNGVIFAKKSKESSPIVIKDLDCVDNLLKRSIVDDQRRTSKSAHSGTANEEYESESSEDE